MFLWMSDIKKNLCSHFWDDFVRSGFLARSCRWSSGVIMYTLLSGSPPFWHRKQMLMLRMILSGKYEFSSPEWEDCSDTAKDLVGHVSACPSPPGSILVPQLMSPKWTLHLVSSDHSDAGGWPKAAIHSQRCPQPRVLLTIRCEWGATVHPIQAVQGETPHLTAYIQKYTKN